MNRTIVAATAVAFCGASGAAVAQSPMYRTDNPSGPYVGAGVGQFNVEIDRFDQVDEAIQRLDDDDTSWKIFAGWRFNPFLSLELAYIDFGRPGSGFDAAGSSGNYSLALDGFAPYVIGTLPLGPVELFAKVGYYFYDVRLRTDFDGDVLSSSSSDEDLLYGVGIGVTFFEHLHARLEYERIDIGGNVDDADALWASAAWRF